MTGGILVTGGSGQLARALGRARRDVRVVGRPEFDFDRPETVARLVAESRPASVVNAAAWTAVDAAETAADAAERANAVGPGLLASVCREFDAALVHISTDYVFDGQKGSPYVETDLTDPQGVYGATKLRGELAVLAAEPRAVVLRTSWVYAETGRNFVLTMLDAARRLPKLRVVADQIGCPTNADDLARAVLAVCDRLVADRADALGGVYHAAGLGFASWHGFAEAIFAEAGAHGWPVPEVERIATVDWPTPARRPADSRLDCAKLAAVFGVALPEWRPSLARAVSAICLARAAPAPA